MERVKVQRLDGDGSTVRISGASLINQSINEIRGIKKAQNYRCLFESGSRRVLLALKCFALNIQVIDRYD